jgi:hypothetical protein
MKTVGDQRRFVYVLLCAPLQTFFDQDIQAA